MVRLDKKRRLAKLRKSMSRWQDSTRGCALDYVQSMEREFKRKEADFVHSGRLVVLKLRSVKFVHAIFHKIIVNATCICALICTNIVDRQLFDHWVSSLGDDEKKCFEKHFHIGK